MRPLLPPLPPPPSCPFPQTSKYSLLLQPAATLATYAALVLADPLALITLDKFGYSPLDWARGRDEGEDIVDFLAAKTAVAEEVWASYVELSKEEFREKFVLWGDL